MSNFTKPESALKRAEELISVEQKPEALQTLHGVITSKRHRAWKKPLEQVMLKHVELCVELRRGEIAKDGLIHYRNACQGANVSSLEAVIKHFIRLSTEKAEQQAQEGMEEEEEVWVKFLWETYRTVLEVLKKDSKLEALYAMTAHGAFQFCKQYKRTAEFRQLCGMIRNHFRAGLNNQRVWRPESVRMWLDTGFEQLHIATELGLWQEAFRSKEDMQSLMSMVEKTSKAWVVYYAKLTEIYWISSSYLEHAYAWFKIFSYHHSFHKKHLAEKDHQMIASAVVLAALAVPLELKHEKQLSRGALLSELVPKGVLGSAIQEVKDIYHLVESEFLPVDLCAKLQPLLSRISGPGAVKLASTGSTQEYKLSQYIPAIQKLATLRLLQEVSRVYDTMRIESLSRIIPFFGFDVVERIAVDAAKHKLIASVKVDHMNGVVMFRDELLVESDGLQERLADFAESLNKARAMVYHPLDDKSSKLRDIVPALGETVDKEHKRLLARKVIIENRKEEEEERQLLEMEREQEESKRLSEQIKRTEEGLEEQTRLDAVYEQLRLERSQRIITERELEEAKALLDAAYEKRIKKIMEKKLQKLAKTEDHLVRAKREAEAPLIEAAFQQRLVDEKALHEREQQLEVELSRKRHDRDLREKKRLLRMMDNKMMFQEMVIGRQQA